METKVKKNVYQMVTERVMEQMKQGIIPWHKPWTGTQGTINYVTRRPYSMLNQILLGREGEWITYKQLKERGGQIKKRRKGGFRGVLLAVLIRKGGATGRRHNHHGN